MTTLKPGDLVRFIDDVGEGRVVRILNNGMIEIRTPDGWDIPVYANRLVFIPEENPSQPKPVVTSIEPKIQRPAKQKTPEPDIGKNRSNESGGVYMAVIRRVERNQNFDGIELMLINDTDCQLIVLFYENRDKRFRLVADEKLEAGMILELARYDLEQLSVIEAFTIQGILVQEEVETLILPLDYQIPFNVKKFAAAGAYTVNDYTDEPAQLFRIDRPGLKEHLSGFEPDKLFAAGIDKEISNKELNRPKEFKSGKPDRIPIEVDLHINKLVDYVIGLGNQDILEIQMARFRKELDSAIIENEREIVFIHGIGNGTLKNELRKVVDQDYPFCYYEDASFKEYGFGATRIFIRHNKPL